MTRLTWDEVGKRFYESGAEQAVLYPYSSNAYATGAAWNGFIAFEQNPEGGDAKPLYANDHQYLQLMSNEKFKGTLKAYTYPKEFEPCMGVKELSKGIKVGQQDRQMFGLSYKTLIGSDAKGTSEGYKIHLVYGCKVSPTQIAYTSETEDPNAIEMSWAVNTTPIEIEGMKPSAHIEISSLDFAPEIMKKLEDKLYGDTSAGNATLPTPSELVTLLSSPEAA